MNARLKQVVQWVGAHKKVLFWVSIAVVLLVLIGRVSLYVNFLLGNDLVVRLQASDESLDLVSNETSSVRFTTTVYTNPFCEASCEYVFEDVSKGVVLQEHEVSMTAGIASDAEFVVGAYRRGEGQDMYRFTVECKSEATPLCHTQGESTRRRALLTLNYAPPPREQALRDALHVELGELKDGIEDYWSAHARATQQYKLLSEVLVDTPQVSELSITREDIRSLERRWQNYEYDAAYNNAQAMRARLALGDAFMDLMTLYTNYNQWVDDYNNAISIIRNASQGVVDTRVANTARRVIDEGRAVRDLLVQRSTMATKQVAVRSLVNQTSALQELSRASQTNETIRRLVSTDVTYAIMCKEVGLCKPVVAPRVRVSGALPTLAQACAYQQGMIAEINAQSLRRANDTSVQYVQGRQKQALSAWKKEVSGAPGVWGDVALDLFDSQAGEVNVSAPATQQIWDALGVLAPDECAVIAIPSRELQEIDHWEMDDSVELVDVSFEQSTSQCCYGGECQACCEDGCALENTPILFVHGHAFNKDTSAYRSLDAFSKVQDRLERELGYLDVGAISLYTDFSIPRLEWSKTRVRKTMDVSYYFDIFQNEESYVLVQTKSENIDTYALRLQELINRVRFRTGKQKVVLVTHSMGGLVARRYMQIFGEQEVERLIMVATPNQGIRARTSDFCNVKGEALECRDMQEDSLFLNKLKRAPPLRIPVLNIIPTGCSMNGGVGDGVVLETSALLQGVRTTYINGTCTTFAPLHNAVLNIDTYPRLYGIIRDELVSVG